MAELKSIDKKEQIKQDRNNSSLRTLLVYPKVFNANNSKIRDLALKTR